MTCISKYWNLAQVWVMFLALLSIFVGCFVGSSLKRIVKDGNLITHYCSASQSPESIAQLEGFDEDYNSIFHLRNRDIYVATNPRGGERLPPGIVKPYSDFSLRKCVGNETDERKPKYLLALAVGIHQKHIVNKIISKFSENFTVVLFHYDGRTSEWDEFEWSQRAIHITAFKQTKWWYVKRFLHPAMVGEYEYIFIWDEDIGVDNFNAQEYLRILRKYGLEISQPAVTSTKGYTYTMTLKRNDSVEVHWEAMGDECHDSHFPPCAGFVEIMAPVFSRNSWNCVWNMIQNDLVHGWGLDFAFHRCVEKPYEGIGVVDAQWITHLVLPTLSNLGEESINGKRSRIWVRARSRAEMMEFSKRLEAADRMQQNHTRLSQKQS